MTKEQKNEVIEVLKGKFSQYSNFYIADTEALSVEQIGTLRRACFELPCGNASTLFPPIQLYSTFFPLAKHKRRASSTPRFRTAKMGGNKPAPRENTKMRKNLSSVAAAARPAGRNRLAFAASLNADAAEASTVGASLVPLIVIVTVSVAVAPLSSVAVTV